MPAATAAANSNRSSSPGSVPAAEKNSCRELEQPFVARLCACS
jgi:hypothetical protein